jgi:hypothetical protein
MNKYMHNFACVFLFSLRAIKKKATVNDRKNDKNAIHGIN